MRLNRRDDRDDKIDPAIAILHRAAYHLLKTKNEMGMDTRNAYLVLGRCVEICRKDIRDRAVMSLLGATDHILDSMPPGVSEIYDALDILERCRRKIKN